MKFSRKGLRTKLNLRSDPWCTRGRMGRHSIE